MDRTYLVSTVIFTIVLAGLLVISDLYSSPYQRIVINFVMVNKTETSAASYNNEMALQREIVYKRRSDHLTQVCNIVLPHGKVSETTLKHDIWLHLDHRVCFFKIFSKWFFQMFFFFSSWHIALLVRLVQQPGCITFSNWQIYHQRLKRNGKEIEIMVDIKR